jgi:diguanylate cyclase (GGDEF)-like protein
MSWHLSIRRLLVGWAILSAVIAIGLTSLGLTGVMRLSAALDQVNLADRALRNHNDADAFMDDVRADVMRALLASTGANKEGAEAIREQLRHHLEIITTAIRENSELPLGPEIIDGYGNITRLIGPFSEQGTSAVDLALRDPVGGAANFELFRHGFSELEDAMDATRDKLRAAVSAAEADSKDARSSVRNGLALATLAGLLLFAVVSRAAIRRAQKMTEELAHSREQAHHLSLHDTLTGLPNRALFARELSQALARDRRHGGQLAVLCMDLDQFKAVNDTLGHPVGDALLREVAKRLSRTLREGDVVARLGGDEFAIIQAELAASDETSALAGRLIDVIGAPYDISGHQVVVGASVGIAFSPSDSSEPDELLKKADMALYRAKADGRSTFRHFEPEMDARLQSRRLLELDLRHALKMGEFELHYQPIVDLRSGAVSACEALLRWSHPTRGMISPAEFVPLAEEVGLIVPLGEWVLRRACADASTWPGATRVAVNLSAIQFRNHGLVTAVRAALANSQLPASRLELEITEAVLLQESEETLAILRELRSLGIRIAMDDFGTGYSSLGYLRSFPFDRIKIDRSFVRDLETSADCEAIIRAITGLSGSLGIATTAEGVETSEQLARLRAEDCDEVQGFYLSRPLPAAKISEFLRSRPSQASDQKAPHELLLTA